MADNEVSQLRAQLRAANVTLANISGALCDTGLPVPEEAKYHEAIREQTRLLRAAEGERDEREAIWLGRLKDADERAERINTKLTAAEEAKERAERDVAGWREACRKANVRADAAEGALREAREALRELLKLLEDGALVRDISHDHEPGWALRQMALVMALKRASVAAGGQCDAVSHGHRCEVEGPHTRHVAENAGEGGADYTWATTPPLETP